MTDRSRSIFTSESVETSDFVMESISTPPPRPKKIKPKKKKKQPKKKDVLIISLLKDK